MQNFCPISFQKINENTARATAILTVLVLALYFYTSYSIIPLFLVFDFAVRGFGSKRFSLLAFLAAKLGQVLSFKKKMINAGPKLFAAQVGTFLSAIAVLGHYFQFPEIAFYTFIILAFFAFLEGALGICVACIIYPYIRKVVPDSYDAGL